MKNKIKEKVLKNQRERNKGDIKSKLNPLWSLKEESPYSGMYNDVIELIEAITITSSEETLAEVVKVIDDFNFDRIVQLIADSGIENQKEIDVLFKQELKQKLGIEVLK